MEIFDKNWSEELKRLSIFSENEEYLTEKQKEKAVLEFYDCEVILDHWANKYVDLHCYSESTADGYEVFVATGDPNVVNISENVYYYSDDLIDQIRAMIEGHDAVIRIDPTLVDDINYDDMITELYYELQEEFENLLRDEQEDV